MNRVIGILVAVILVTGCDWGVNEHQERQNSADVQQEGVPFVLIARLHSLPGKANELLKLSRAVDRKVEQSEPGMLLHTFDQDPDDPLGFVWTEVYASSEAFEYHLQNPDPVSYTHLTLPTNREV